LIQIKCQVRPIPRFGAAIRNNQAARRCGTFAAAMLPVGLGSVMPCAPIFYVTAITAHLRIWRDLRKISLLPRFGPKV
jgi:hypothetical protein